jgi:hypothetical protein
MSGDKTTHVKSCIKKEFDEQSPDYSIRFIVFFWQRTFVAGGCGDRR